MKKDDATHNEPIEEAHNVQIGNVVVNKVGFKDVQSAIVTFRIKCYNKKPTDVISLIHI
jgi:spore maturation protein SpmA